MIYPYTVLPIVVPTYSLSLIKEPAFGVNVPDDVDTCMEKLVAPPTITNPEIVIAKVAAVFIPLSTAPAVVLDCVPWKAPPLIMIVFSKFILLICVAESSIPTDMFPVDEFVIINVASTSYILPDDNANLPPTASVCVLEIAEPSDVILIK